MSDSPRVIVILDRTTTAPSILRDAKTLTGYGLSEIRSRIVAGLPVVIEEMFSNAWYDERAQLLLALLTKWQNESIVFEVREVAENDDTEAGALISLEVLRNIIESDDNESRDGI
ncbi:hypothetical protein ACMG4H_03140 [Corynebacterium glutamicum]|uniref:hypothetical protein n=1 Tax=Corynebacterium glutamicum TaxID=1718 RepID=UPI003C7B18C7